jgi:hypothetical protein
MPPEAAIFTTPDNQQFYSKGRYKPLDPKAREVRLLKIHPQRLRVQELAIVFPNWVKQDNTDASQLVKSSTSEMLDSKEPLICCELFEQIPLQSITGKFSALSYCAGSANDTVKIMVDGYWFNAFANLAHSLERFQDLYDKESGSGYLLWTDQVCVNQSDPEEKSHQVEFMRAIYEAAESTYVVLSTPSCAIETAERGEVALRMLLNTWACGPLSFDISVSDPARKSLKEAFEKMDFQQALSLLAFCKDILEANWWQRAWVGHDVKSLCGRSSLQKLTKSGNRCYKSLLYRSK